MMIHVLTPPEVIFSAEMFSPSMNVDSFFCLCILSFLNLNRRSVMHRKDLLKSVLLRAFLFGVLFVAQVLADVPPAANSKQARLEQLVEANITAVHAYQMLLARKQQNMDPACWSANSPKDSDLEMLVTHQTSLLSSVVDAKAWASGAPSAFDPTKDLQPLLAAKLSMPANLPVNLFAAIFGKTHRSVLLRKFAPSPIFIRLCLKSSAMGTACKTFILSILRSVFRFM
jgi:hypothetical protein